MSESHEIIVARDGATVLLILVVDNLTVKIEITAEAARTIGMGLIGAADKAEVFEEVEDVVSGRL